MSAQDRARWEDRYRSGSYGTRQHPSAWLAHWWPRLELPANARVADLACGTGRNALFFAQACARVTAVDIARAALEQGAERALEQRLEVTWVEADLEHGWSAAGLPVEERFDLISVVRYLNLPLLAELGGLLAPGGWLAVEVHAPSSLAVAGPQSERFRASAEAVAGAVAGLQTISLEQGWVRDPDDRLVALTRLLARAPLSV